MVQHKGMCGTRCDTKVCVKDPRQVLHKKSQCLPIKGKSKCERGKVQWQILGMPVSYFNIVFDQGHEAINENACLYHPMCSTVCESTDGIWDARV